MAASSSSTRPARAAAVSTTAVYPRLIRHELGHAMGYYHTDDAADVMYGNAITSRACNVDASERERRHAKFAHGSKW